MNKKAVLILDFGTSNVRAILSSTKTGKIIDKTNRKNKWMAPKDGWAQMDPNLLWENAQEVVEEVVSRSSSEYEIAGIGFSFFGDSLILTDEQLNPLYDMVMAFDRRAYEEAKELEEIIGKDHFKEIVGGPSLSMLVCAKILWFRHHMPDLFQKTKYFLNIQEFILGKLGLGLWTDYTLANRKTMLDIKKKDWSEELMDVVGVKKEQLGGKIGNSDLLLGSISKFGRVKLPYECKVILGAHDSECGFLGLGVVPGQNDVIGNVSGTYEMMGSFSTRKSDVGILEKGCGTHKDQMIISGSSIAGAYVSWFRNLTKNQSEQFFDRMEQELMYDGKDKIFFLADNDSDQCVIDGMTTKTSDIQFYQAVIEGITFKLKYILTAMEENKIVKENAVIMSGGGGTASDKWLQFKADLFNKKVCRMKNKEVSALGAAMLVSVGTGIYKDMKEAAQNMIEVEIVFEPRREVTEKYEQKYGEYLRKMNF